MSSDAEDRAGRRPARRRARLLMAGAALGLLVLTGGAGAADVDGTVGFARGAAIPEGIVEVYLDDPGGEDRGLRRLTEVRLASDGRSASIGFSLARPPGAEAPRGLRVIARLKRKDGWLIARGSARVVAGTPLRVTMTEVAY